MKRAAILPVLAFLFFASMRSTDPVSVYGIETDIKPSTFDEYMLLRPTPYTFTGRAFVQLSPDRREPRVGLKVVVEPGERQTATTKFNGYDVNFTVSLSDRHDQARTEVVLKRDGVTQFRQASDVLLTDASGRTLPRR